MLRSLILLAMIAATPNLQAMEVPTLRLKSYSELKYPPQLPKSVLRNHLRQTARALHGVAFENLGDMSDWMHGHVLFRPPDGAASPARPLTDPAWEPDWSKLDLKGILFHTQEYDHLRKGRPYVGPQGSLDTYDRNWILMLTETSRKLVRALYWMDETPKKRPFTIRSDDLLKRVFGANPGNWEYSVYFFRVKCDQLAAYTEAEIEDSNVFELYLKDERYCLAFESFHCRNNSETDPRCQRGPQLEYQTAL